MDIATFVTFIIPHLIVNNLNTDILVARKAGHLNIKTTLRLAF